MNSENNKLVWNREGQWRTQRASPVAIVVKNMPANAGNVKDPGSTLGFGKSLGGGHGNPLQYSCLGNPMDRRPYRLQSLGLQRVRHNWSDLACMHAENPELAGSGKNRFLVLFFYSLIFFFCDVFVWFWYQGDIKPSKMSLEVFLPLWCLGSILRRIGVNFPINVW